jgi:hypothetical protein
VFSPTGDLSTVPSYIRGSTAVRATGEAGTRLSTIKVLGSFIGDVEAASARLVERVKKTLASLLPCATLACTRCADATGDAAFLC